MRSVNHHHRQHSHFNGRSRKRSEAKPRCWVKGRITAQKYRMPDKQGPNRVVDGCSKRLAGRFHQLKTGHCLTGIPPLDKEAADDQMLEVQYQTRTREHFSKCCPHRKCLQKILWAEVRKQTGRGKNRPKPGTSLRTSAVVKRSWAFFLLRKWDEGCG